MGATEVLDTAAEIPPAMKSLAKATGSASAGAMTTGELFDDGDIIIVEELLLKRAKSLNANETRYYILLHTGV